jgi:hypothetical protein
MPRRDSLFSPDVENELSPKKGRRAFPAAGLRAMAKTANYSGAACKLLACI